MLRPPLRAQIAVCAYWLLLPINGCVRERTLFEAAAGGQSGQAGIAGLAQSGIGGTAGSSAGIGGIAGSSAGIGGIAGASAGGTSGAAGASGDGGNGGAPSLPWTQSSCMDSLYMGKTGDPCLEVFKCNESVECCSYVAYCDGKVLDVQRNCPVCPKKCSADSDCGAKELCENYQCRTCPTDPCPDTWSPVLRNGCPVCVPPNQCKEAGDPACGALSCVPGLSCLPGCKADPSCCFGNRCVEPKCTTLKEFDCLIVGCYAGSLCKVGGPARDCKCQPSTGSFGCTGNSYNTCVSY